MTNTRTPTRVHWPKALLNTSRARCMHPNCMSRITWRRTQVGRNAAFCSTGHRVAYFRERQRLVNQLAAAEQRHNASEASRLRWLLVRYPKIGNADAGDDLR